VELGGPELLVILVIVVLIFGPGRVTGLARSLGAAIHEFRSGLSSDSTPDEESDEDAKLQ
jgi:sec-independent protein translocase protein TatA